MPNWNCTNYNAPVLEKYKRGFFIEWRLADRYKKIKYEKMDYMLETEERDNPKLITGEVFRNGLDQFSKQPFRMEPYFDPGVWGGHWMQTNFGLDPDKENFAWSFDGVPAENYVNKVPVNKHDHILIPAGTIHCSGKNTMVLEISATPYIFTFKLWDWGRVGLDGIPRPIHVEHGLKNIQWNRDTDWIYENLVNQQETVKQGEGYEVERTGLHNREFIDTFRYTLTEAYTVEMKDTVHVMNLVDGSHVLIKSRDDSFEPFEIHYAETAIVPAKVGSYVVEPENEKIKLIVASVR